VSAASLSPSLVDGKVGGSKYIVNID